ncbi:ectoine hydroxylase [Halopseudomonas maritima]|uniref:ectoine hydroxylase n=1 Tax=Halopseudomonas maritima TaxID=2918528 RepID=UPI001EEAF434|nr:ectoine hydroxylase [Halopseudomonas maritima]UJJ31020.1 ectoine hydroxylase [Halopseudomonas maritima]
MTAAVDLYPTRRQDQPRWHERIDPIIYRCHDREAPLTAQQIDQFERDGFLLLPNAFSAEEVAVFRREVERLRSDTGILASDAAIREPDSGALRSLFAIHQSSDLFARVAADERIAGKVRHLLDGDLYVHQSRLNMKPGFKGKEFYWHSDFETWHAEDGLPRMRTISGSILLTDNSPCNGPLLLVPGSHRYFISCVGETPEEHYRRSLRKQELGVPDDASLADMVSEGGITAATGQAGSVILFDCNTLHGSNSNITPDPRSNLFYVYNHVDNLPVEPFGAETPRPAFVAERGPVTPLHIAPQRYL